jgi:glycosyltransferase involved in cell wall biosynthesis
MREEIRVILVHPHLRYGGAERQSVTLANELRNRGVRVAVVVFQVVGELVEELAPDIEVVGLNLEGHAQSWLIARRLRAYLATRPPSIVMPRLWSAMFVASLTERRLRGHTFIYAEDLDPTSHVKYVKFGRLKSILMGRIFRSREYVVAVGAGVADGMMATYNLTHRPLVIPPAVDLESLGSAGAQRRVPGASFLREAPEGYLKVLSVGSLVRLKGLDVTAQAICRLRRPCRWLIIGDGPMRPEVEAWGERGIEVCVVAGHPRPFDLGAEADVLVHSALSEAFGMVVVEALASGIRVICSETVGGKEIAAGLSNKSSILRLYPTGDVGALARLMDEVPAGTPTVESVTLMRRELDIYSKREVADSWLVAIEAVNRADKVGFTG